MYDLVTYVHRLYGATFAAVRDRRDERLRQPVEELIVVGDARELFGLEAEVLCQRAVHVQHRLDLCIITTGGRSLRNGPRESQATAGLLASLR